LEEQTMDDVNSDQETSAVKTSEPTKRRVSRRGLIAKGAAAAAGGVGLAALAADPAHATVGTMVYGTQMNAGADATALNSTNTTYTFAAYNTGTGPGVLGTSTNGSYGVLGDSPSGDGVRGKGNQGVVGNGTIIGVQGVGAYTGVSGGGYLTGVGLHGFGGRAQLHLEPMFETSGPPTSNNHLRGEVFVDSLGRHFLCVAAGTPGTWVRPGLNPITPLRVCDTRAGTGTPYSTGAKLGPGANLEVEAAGVPIADYPVPAGATAIIANLTVTGATATSHLTVYPANVPRPTASNINFVSGQTIANQVTVGLDTDGRIRVYNNAGSTHVIIDIAGFFF
jgi:hypothetical protein